jgi:hypothetical protein
MQALVNAILEAREGDGDLVKACTAVFEDFRVPWSQTVYSVACRLAVTEDIQKRRSRPGGRARDRI